MVSRWESGDYNFTIKTISEILDKLDLDLTFDVVKDKSESYAVVPIIRLDKLGVLSDCKLPDNLGVVEAG